MWATLLQIKAPPCAWCHQASTKHPGVGLKVTSYYSRPNGNAMEIVEMTGDAWQAAVADIKSLSSVEEVEVLESGPTSARIRVAAKECALPAAIEASGIVPQLPFDVSLGCDKWLLLSPKDRAKDFYDNLVAHDVKVDVMYSGEYTPEVKLTARQQEILDAAISHGYYDYPRRITLTNLAGKLNIAKSTLSQSLMLVESEVVKRAGAQATTRK